MRPFILGFLANHYLLQQSNDRTSLGCPLLLVGIDFFEYVESAQCPEKVPHFVTVVSNHDQKGLVVAWAHAFLQLPSVLRLTVHDVDAREPGEEDGVRALVLTLHVVKGFLGGLEVLGVG